MVGATTDQLIMLSMIIVKNIKQEFMVKKLSGNLANTIEVYEDAEGIHVHIPAKTYNMLKFQKEGILIHTSNGSYAQRLDNSGSEFYYYDKETGKKTKIKPGNHKGFVDKVIADSINEWRRLYNIDAVTVFS